MIEPMTNGEIGNLRRMIDMDKKLLDTKRFDIYFSTWQFGVGIMYVTDHKSLHIQLGVFEFVFYFGGYE